MASLPWVPELYIIYSSWACNQFSGKECVETFTGHLESQTMGVAQTHAELGCRARLGTSLLQPQRNGNGSFWVSLKVLSTFGRMSKKINKKGKVLGGPNPIGESPIGSTHIEGINWHKGFLPSKLPNDQLQHLQKTALKTYQENLLAWEFSRVCRLFAPKWKASMASD